MKVVNYKPMRTRLDDWWSVEPTLCEWQATAAHSPTSWVTLNCVMFIDESAQCCGDRGGTLNRAEWWNAPIEENTDGQPSSAARRPVPRHGMSTKRKQPKRKCNAGRKGKGGCVSQITFFKWFCWRASAVGLAKTRVLIQQMLIWFINFCITDFS